MTQFQVGDTINVTGTTSNDDKFTVVAVVDDSELTVLETTTSESPASCTLTTFDARYCGENGVDIKQGPGPVYVEHNRILFCRNTLTNGDSTGSNGAGIAVHQDSDNVYVRGNLIQDCTQGITVAALTPAGEDRHIEVMNNLITISEDFLAQPATNEKALVIGDFNRGTFCNNTVIGGSDTEILSAYNTTGPHTIKNNVFMNGDISSSITDGNFVQSNAWVNIVSVPAVLQSSTDLVDVDLKLDETYKPKQGSPCIDAGSPVDTVHDLYGRVSTTNGNTLGAVWPDPKASETGKVTG